MKKLFFITGLSLLSGNLFASASTADQDLSLLKGKVQGIEGRLDELERSIKEIKIKGKFEDLPLKQANITTDELLNWVTDAVVSLYSYNYLNIQQALNKSRHYFTDNGYDSFMKALQDSKNLETVKNKKLVVNAIPTGAATVAKEGNVDGTYTWQVEVPLQVAYQGADNEFKQNMNIQVEIVRQSYSQAEKGVAINAITAKLLSTTNEAKPDASPKPTPTPSATPTKPNVDENNQKTEKLDKLR